MLSILNYSLPVLKNSKSLFKRFKKLNCSFISSSTTLAKQQALIKDSELAYLDSKHAVMLEFFAEKLKLATEKQDIALKALEEKHKIEMDYLTKMDVDCLQESSDSCDNYDDFGEYVDGEEDCTWCTEEDENKQNNHFDEKVVLKNSHTLSAPASDKLPCIATETMDDNVELDFKNIKEYTPKIAQEIVNSFNKYSFHGDFHSLASPAIFMKKNLHGSNATNLKNAGFGRAVLNALENEKFWNNSSCVYMIELITDSPNSLFHGMFANSPPSLLQDMFDEISKQDYHGILYKMMLKSLQGGTEVCEKDICPLISMISQHSVASKNKMIESGIVDQLVKRREKKRSEGWGDSDIGTYYGKVFKNLGV